MYSIFIAFGLLQSLLHFEYSVLHVINSMRLLRLPSLKFEELCGDRIPNYGILSHTWGKEEVSYQDMLYLDRSLLHSKAGYRKISRCCATAAATGMAYVWIDTCCIDKTSSAELTEAINSMFQWYANSKICWAYLEDVSLTDQHVSAMGQFYSSRWFTRGWTLQELLAPKNMIFLDAQWEYLGTKPSLLADISQAGGIDRQHILDFRKASVAAKMSWASKRKTTRIEDMAYSLMGLFDVNMPLLYGEGMKAFMRLQHEITRISDDETIFAWKDASLGESGIFALSPAAFADSRFYISHQFPQLSNRPPYTVTHKGLAIELVLDIRHRHSIAASVGEMYSSFGESVNTMFSLASLRCLQLDQPDFPIAIELKRVRDHDFVRINPSTLFKAPYLGPKIFLCYIRPMYTSKSILESERYSFTFAPFWQKNEKITLLETSFAWDDPPLDNTLYTVTLNGANFLGMFFEYNDVRPHQGRRTQFAIMLRGSRYQPPTAHVLRLTSDSFSEKMKYYGDHFFGAPERAWQGKGDAVRGYSVSVSFVDISNPGHTNFYVNIAVSEE